MSNIDELAVTMTEIGAGPWELTLDSGETIAVDLDEVEVTEQHGFHADGRRQGEAGADVKNLVELSTGIQPGGTIHLRQRASTDEDWETLGEVIAADKQDYV